MTEKYIVKNLSGYLKWVDGQEIGPRSEEEVELTEEGLSYVEGSSRLKVVRREDSEGEPEEVEGSETDSQTTEEKEDEGGDEE